MGRRPHGACVGHCCLASPRAGSPLAPWPWQLHGPRLSGLQGVLPCSWRTRGLGALRCTGCFTSSICFPATAAIWLFPSLDTFFLTPRFSTRLSSFSVCRALAPAAISKSPAVKGSSLRSCRGSARGCPSQEASAVFCHLAAFCPNCCRSILPAPGNPWGMPSGFAGPPAFCFTPSCFTFVKPSFSGSFPMEQK